MTRAGLVSRPRLFERLDAALPAGDDPAARAGLAVGAGFVRTLGLISAPAGFGKTTLVSEWSRSLANAEQSIHIAWLSLDKGDNDLVRFLAYVIAALRQSRGLGPDSEDPIANIGQGALTMLMSPQPPTPEVVLTSLVNELTALPCCFLLILDDYHLIEAQEVREAVAFLLDHLPPQLHLVIVTREDPELPLARLIWPG
jgi:LuxR family maltose regulon positive regulatory protein